MGVTAVNLQAFQDFRQLVATSAAGRYLPEIAVRVGAALMKQVADEFRESRDPYGVPWKPVYRWVRGQGRLQGKPLIKTGRLRASVVPRVTGSAVRIALPVEYASYHQFGTRRIPRRQILPDTATGGLGARWTMAVNKEIAAVVEKYLGGRR